MLILKTDLINNCRVCRSPNQDGDYQCLFEASIKNEEGTTELSESGILYENLLDIHLRERYYYPQFLCNSCDLQMKLFKKLKDKALKSLEYFQRVYGNIIIDQVQTENIVSSNYQDNEEIIYTNDLQNYQGVLDENQIKEYEVLQENEAHQYAQNITVEYDTNKAKTINENKNYNCQNEDVESELNKSASNNSYNQVLLEQECLYTEQQLTNSMTSNMEPNFEADIELQIDATVIQSDENVKQESSISVGNISIKELEPILDKNDYVTEIYELIDDECSEKETNLENQEIGEDVIDYEIKTETSSTYNDIEYLLEEDIYDSEDYTNQIELYSGAVKRRRLNNECKKSRGYNCLTCQLEFKSLQEYKLHRTEEHNENYTCNACSKEFKTVAALQVHIKSLHNAEPAFQCEICPKTFNQKVHYQYHMNNHNNVRNFKCDICEKAFIAKADLKTHLRLHTGERPYVCNICGKDYLMMEHLKAHLITHTERRFPCNVCQKQFSTPKTLRLHVRTIHENATRFKCTFCLKPFRRKHHLEYHLKSHLTNVKNLEIRNEIRNESSEPENLGEEAIDDPDFILLP